MAVSTRKSRMAVVEESTAGTLLAPSSAGDYIALQDGFSLVPAFDALDNAELKASIGKSKSIQGLEQPSGSLSHYVYHSGTEGAAPEIDLLLKSAMGASSVASTEYDTVSSSTAGTATAAAVIKVNTGEGATFERGESLLIKDSTNGYSIRPIASISSDDLTLGFNLPGAPASGVNLGKAVLYKPDDSSHPSLSVWDYRGNGGAIQAVAGCKVTEMSIEAEAGGFINASFSMDGLKYYFNPVEITSSTRYLDFTDSDGTWAAAVATGWYRDPHELAAAVQTAMQAANSGETPTVTYSDSTGKYTIKTTNTTLSLLWNTGTNAANTIATKLGFSAAANSTGTAATTGYTSANAYTLTSPQTPSLDGQDPLVAKDNNVFLGDFADNVCFGAQTLTCTLSNDIVGIKDICEVSGQASKVVNGRTVTVEVTATLASYDVDKFKRFRANEETSFFYAFGPKSGGNYVAGKCGSLYIPRCTITSFEVVDTDGVVALNMGLQAYVSSSEGEFFVNFL